jgi:hypothetical protein
MNYLPLLRQANPPASQAMLDELRAYYDRPIPADYLEFLQQANGGRFAANLVRLPADAGGDTVLNRVLPADRAAKSNVYGDYELYRSMDRVPTACIAFADDPGGNAFLLSLEPESQGAIFFWDHENEPADGGARFTDFPNAHRIAPSFAAFIGALEPDQG